MSSPVVFSLTAAQVRALRRLADGKAEDERGRTARQLSIKGLVSAGSQLALTPAGEAAALMVARLNEASPVSKGPGTGVEQAVSAPGRAPLGSNARSSEVSGDKSQEINESPKSKLSRLALSLLSAGGYLTQKSAAPPEKLVCTFTPEDWNLIAAHNAQEDVLRKAELAGKPGVRSLLAKLRIRSLPSTFFDSLK